ncbi:MAG TPA: efflux transporter outer membrane subunit [Sphingobium sp.]|nr:efflux transporter outer membrane subunit [Sphingobium sp.]
MTRHPLVTAAIIPALLLAGCNFAPAYRTPVSVAIPPSFKEAPGWKIATPSDAVARGEWWRLFNDDTLNDLERRVLVSNQNLASAKAAYDQARALVREERAALFPVVSLQGQGNRSGSFGNSAATIGTSGTSGSLVSLGIGATWEPDLWGAIGNAVSQNKALAQASAGDLINATLSAQGELALDYVQLRGIEAQKLALDQTVADYTRALTITVNMYNAGVSARSDVLQAEVALRNAKADAADLIRQRAILEHAIAVLVGESASTFSLPAGKWNRVVPEVPAILPSTLLERRPDVAAAERRVAAANAGIGIQKAAFFPTISLSGQAGSTATSVAGLFDAASTVWSLGLTGLLTLLDFGARSARVDQARAGYEQAVATYRQTVLTAFQQVEDQLAATDILRTVSDERAAAAVAADRAEVIARNQYVAGQVGYAAVIVAQTTALAARTSDIQAVTNRQTAAISLVQAIGGHWSTPLALPSGP